MISVILDKLDCNLQLQRRGQPHYYFYLLFNKKLSKLVPVPFCDSKNTSLATKLELEQSNGGGW